MSRSDYAVKLLRWIEIALAAAAIVTSIGTCIAIRHHQPTIFQAIRDSGVDVLAPLVAMVLLPLYLYWSDRVAYRITVAGLVLVALLLQGICVPIP